MTSDKQNAGHLASKPFKPSLSAAFHRTNKPPLTPKLATPNSGGYRTPRRLAPSEHPSSTATTPSKDDYLAANVTPRSNSRTSRRDVVNGSPTSTPSGPLSAPQTPYSQPGMAPGSVNGGAYRSERSPVRAGMKLEPPRPNRARTLTAESQHHAARPVSSPEGSAGARRFFHASDARSSNSPDPEPRPSKSAGKSSSSATFFYANGREEEDSAKRRSTGPTSRAGASSKLPPTPSSTSASPSPRFKLSSGTNESGRLSDGLNPSVSSDEAQESPSHRLSAPSSNLPERPPPVPIRRHIKSSSVDSGSSALSPREALRPSPLSPSDPQVPQINTNVGDNNNNNNNRNNNDAMSAADAIQAILPRLFSNMSSSGSGDTQASTSPVKSETASQSTSDPAANARVGRKIMDLEISNSSLLAINRTLEREMRKQNAELRRFRRLSRAGHFSAAPARPASGPTLDTTHEVEEGSSEISNTQPTDDLSDITDEEEDEEEGDSADEGVMSPGSLAEHDAKHRVSDEKHVFTDLAKHQELLVDSQKMNQSLRRCLGWTEELIREGQKALEYNVHVNDVELGGRVLAPEELLDIGESARGLLSSSATSDYKSDMSSIASSDMDDSASVSTATDIA